MFYIDNFNRDDSLTLEDAVNLINSYNREQGLLENMMGMRDKLASFMNQDDFCDDWCYEINAYNKVFSDMSQLFGTAQ
jgi:hypothetical protein